MRTPPRDEPLSKRTRNIILIVAGIILVCCCAAVGGIIALNWVTNTIVENAAVDPADLAVVKARVADFDPPPGYQTVGSRLLGMDVLFMGPTNGEEDLHYVLVQIPENFASDDRTMEAQLHAPVTSFSQGRRASLSIVDTETRPVRGEESEFTIREGTTEEGGIYRQMTGFFDGNEGRVLVSIFGPQEMWDEQEISSFLASIR